MIKEFIDVINELTCVFADLATIAGIKLKASAENRIATIEDCMKKEQSLSMKVRGLDTKREKLQQQMGYEGLTFRQIIDKGDEETVRLLTPVFEAFTYQVNMYKTSNESVTSSININLRKIQRDIENRQGIRYQKNLEEIPEDTHLTNRSV